MLQKRKCKRCGRTGKRVCPKEKGFICSLCCGQQRDILTCPFDCEYLRNWLKEEKARLEQVKAKEYQALTKQELEDLRANFQSQGIFQNLLVRSIPEGSKYSDDDARQLLEYINELFRIKTSGLIYEPPLQNLKIKIWFDLFIKKKKELEKLGVKLTDREILQCAKREERALQFYSKERFAKNPYLTQLIVFLPEIKEKDEKIIKIT